MFIFLVISIPVNSQVDKETIGSSGVEPVLNSEKKLTEKNSIPIKGQIFISSGTVVSGLEKHISKNVEIKYEKKKKSIIKKKKVSIVKKKSNSIKSSNPTNSHPLPSKNTIQTFPSQDSFQTLGLSLSFATLTTNVFKIKTLVYYQYNFVSNKLYIYQTISEVIQNLISDNHNLIYPIRPPPIEFV